MSGRPHTPEVTLKLRDTGVEAALIGMRWVWELRWQVEKGPELAPDGPKSKRLPISLNADYFSRRSGWARSQRAAQKKAEKEWRNVCKEAAVAALPEKKFAL